jgi:hypothetical protein
LAILYFCETHKRYISGVPEGVYFRKIPIHRKHILKEFLRMNYWKISLTAYLPLQVSGDMSFSKISNHRRERFLGVCEVENC